MNNKLKWLNDFQEKEEMEERLESSGEGHLVVANPRGLSDWDVRSLSVWITTPY